MGSNAFKIVFAASDGADGSGIDQCATPVLLTLSRIFLGVRCIEHRQRRTGVHGCNLSSMP